MLNNFVIPSLYPAAPEIFLVLMSFLILFVDLLFGAQRRWMAGMLSIVTLLGCALITVVTFGLSAERSTLGDMFWDDPLADVLKLMTYIAVSMMLIYGRGYMRDRNLDKGEFYLLTLYATLGMMVMISAAHFLTVYLGLELLSLSLYALVAIDRQSVRSTEAAMKYFVLGSMASGVLLYGMSMIYGATGTLHISGVFEALRTPSGEASILMIQHRAILVLGLVFVVAGIAFKLGLVPFHTWLPDVYQGAPTPVTMLLGSAPKLAAFAMVIRLLLFGMFPLVTDWQNMMAIMAILSIALGNLAAIAQTNLKRMLAYSAISHMGYMVLGMIGVTVDNMIVPSAYASSMYYTIVYALMSLGVFGMILAMTRPGFEAESLDDYRGLNKRDPWLAALMLIFMFSMAGIPFFVGFWAKLEVLMTVVDAGYVKLAVAAVIFSLIGAFYYLRVVKLMYFDPPTASEPICPGPEVRVLLTLNGFAVVALGLFPDTLMRMCVFAIRAAA